MNANRCFRQAWVFNHTMLSPWVVIPLIITLFLARNGYSTATILWWLLTVIMIVWQTSVQYRRFNKKFSQ